MSDNMIFQNTGFDAEGRYDFPPGCHISLAEERARLAASEAQYRCHLIVHGDQGIGENGASRLYVYPTGVVRCDDLIPVLRNGWVVALRRPDGTVRLSEAMRMVIEFHRTFELPMSRTPVRPASVDGAILDGRGRLQHEETGELLDAISRARHGYTEKASLEGSVDIADALADIVYAAYGTALTFGVDLDAALAEVHRSNLTKLPEDGVPLKREDGKVVKGPDYEAPDLRRVLLQQLPLW